MSKIREILVKYSDNKKANDEIEKEIEGLIAEERRQTAIIYLQFAEQELQAKLDSYQCATYRYTERCATWDCIQIVKKITSNI